MNTKKYLNELAAAAFILFAFASFSCAQTAKSSNPRPEKLLNNLKLLMWQDATADKVTVKLRVHSGAAFDTLGKEGTMALLADALFPNETVKEFFKDDLNGSLAVESNYDYLQISATGNAGKVLTILETVAAAVTKPTLDRETTAKVKAVRLERIKELEKNPAYVADLAVAKRLFGDYPYGKSAEGTPASLAKIDFADLILAKQRFLTADNATLAVSGNIKYEYVFKIVRQLFGGWEKADRKVPATFAQPPAPDTKEFSIDTPNSEYVFIRSAMIVAGRNGKDFYATKILTEIWRSQFCLNDESKRGISYFQPHLLRGIYIVGTKVPFNAPSEPPPSGRNPCQLMLQKDGKPLYPPILQNDFDTAKNKVVAELNQKAQSSLDSIDLWLDLDTYKLASVKGELQNAANVILADAQKVSENLQKQSLISVITKKSGEAKK